MAIERAVVGTALAGAAASLFDHESLKFRRIISLLPSIRDAKRKRDLSLSHLK